jgi:hypothetical protein
MDHACLFAYTSDKMAVSTYELRHTKLICLFILIRISVTTKIYRFTFPD